MFSIDFRCLGSLKIKDAALITGRKPEAVDSVLSFSTCKFCRGVDLLLNRSGALHICTMHCCVQKIRGTRVYSMKRTVIRQKLSLATCWVNAESWVSSMLSTFSRPRFIVKSFMTTDSGDGWSSEKEPPNYHYLALCFSRWQSEWGDAGVGFQLCMNGRFAF